MDFANEILLCHEAERAAEARFHEVMQRGDAVAAKQAADEWKAAYRRSMDLLSTASPQADLT